MLQLSAKNAILMPIIKSAGENMLKRGFSLVLTALMLMCLVSCVGESSAVKFGDYEVPIGVYNYFYDEAKNEDDVKKAAEEKCKAYLATQILMEKENLTLSSARKREAAEQTEKLWSMFSAYYQEIDVTKQDITKIQTYLISKKELLHFYYGSGENEVSTAALKNEFNKNYVAFKSLEESLKKVNDIGEKISLSADEKKTLKSKFEAIAKRVNNGCDIDEENERYNEEKGLIVTQSLSLNIIKEDDPLYSSEFFSSVSKLSYNKAAVIECGGNLYMVQRFRADKNEETFSLYADDVLENMKMAAVEDKIEKQAKAIK